MVGAKILRTAEGVPDLEGVLGILERKTLGRGHFLFFRSFIISTGSCICLAYMIFHAFERPFQYLGSSFNSGFVKRSEHSEESTRTKKRTQ